jgi:dihydrofolate reductase
LYGRRLYENMAASWPTVDESSSASGAEVEYAHMWKGMKKIVISRTRRKVEWNSQVVSENIAEEVNRLRARPGKDMSVGGAGLASSFTQLGLIDECRLYVRPIILGSGKPMFPQLNDRMKPKLIEARTFGSGVVLLRLANADVASPVA